MSYLEPKQGRLKWLAEPATTSLRPAPVCARCGGSLAAKPSLAGNCTKCAIELAEEDEALEAYAIRHGNTPSWG